MTTEDPGRSETAAAAATQSEGLGEHLGPDGLGHPRRNLILVIMCLCLVLVVAAVSSLNVAIPTIVRALDPSSTQQLWIIDAYALVFAGLLLLAGALGDRYGRRHALIIGLVIFGGVSILAAYATDANQLITYRAIMGIGAALMMPATLSTLTVVFAPKDRAKAIAIWAGFAGAGAAIGPVASGLLLEEFWWGSVFFITVPIALIALVAIIAVVPNSADQDKHPLDYVGAALSVVALVALVFAIIEGPEIGWLDPVTMASFVVAIGAGFAYLRWERSVEHPLLDPKFFRIPRFGLGSLTITVTFLAMFGMFFLLTLYLQFVLGYSPLGAAVRLLPFSVVMIALAPRNPQLVKRFGTRQVVATGFFIQSIGFGLATLLDVDTSYWQILLTVIPLAAGMALLMPPTTNAIVTSLPENKAGVASAVNDTTREVGGAIGIALLGTLVTVSYQSGMTGATDGLAPPLAELAEDSIGGAFRVAAQLDPAVAGPLIQTANRAFVDGTRVSFAVAAALGLVMAVIIGRFYPDDEETTDETMASTP
ncbi:MAG: DHA2 family efflux MFS transporter permease subunit [Actinomycetia bacterium]|nr:DHA2 family efflux MFS transporter permease subunit [Actinomycetes bacterium]MCP5035085.1 DHA2 family efflux MFS transporter permease subunit [Actinomycetes bacterium]